MNEKLYLKHYRLREEDNLRAPSIANGGSTFKASDTRTGAPVLLTLLPIAAVADDEREAFEARARAVVQFDHPQVARTVDFGRENDEYAFVSEYPRGETTSTWVAQNGRMPPEAVLRIALQVVNALGAAAFQKIFHADIRPSNLVILPGQTADGGWPSIKLINLATAGIGDSESRPGEALDFASPEQVRDGVIDFRTSIYSLGATMCFLLTGVFYQAEPRSLQTRRFARPLRKLIEPMLRQNPDNRPQDPVRVTDTLRACLESVERRQDLARRFGIPLLAVRSRPVRPVRTKPPAPQRKLPKQILAPIAVGTLPVEADPMAGLSTGRRRSPVFAIAAALVLGLAIIGAAAIPLRHFFFGQRYQYGKGEIGVPVGVAHPAPVWEGKPLQMDRDRLATASAAASESGRVASAPGPQQSPVAAASPVAVASPVVAHAGAAEPAPPAEGPLSVWEKAGNRPLSERIVSKDGVVSASNAEVPGKTEQVARSSPADQSDRMGPGADDRNSSNSIVRSKPGVAIHPAASPSRSREISRRTGRQREGRASVARIASDGSIILRLPNGEMAVLPPPRDEYPVHRRYRRTTTTIEHRTVIAPEVPPGFPFPPDEFR